MSIKTFLLMLAVAAATPQMVSARVTAADAFTSAPRKVMPMLDENTRLDMVDYFNSGMSTTSANNLNGRSRITALSPDQLTVSLTDASTCNVIVLPGEQNPMLALITTVATPAPDSRMSVFTADWKRDVTPSVFAKPTLADWLTPAGKKNMAEVEATVPFLLIGYVYDPATATLTLTNNAAGFLGEDVYETVAEYIQPQLVYKFNGKRFNLVK